MINYNEIIKYIEPYIFKTYPDVYSIVLDVELFMVHKPPKEINGESHKIFAGPGSFKIKLKDKECDEITILNICSYQNHAYGNNNNMMEILEIIILDMKTNEQEKLFYSEGNAEWTKPQAEKKEYTAFYDKIPFSKHFPF